MADVTPLQRRLADRCRALREQGGLSQLDLVRHHNWSLSHYQKIERGVLDARLTTLQKLADTFDVSLSKLLDGV